MFLINGLEQEYLSVKDRAVQFGDGVFTTARIINGHVCLYDAHVKRLQEDCKRLFIPFFEWDVLRTEMCTISKNINHGVLKVIISRGIGDRGYSIKNCVQPNRILSVSSYPKNYDKWRNSGITLVTSPVQIGRNPMLAGIKHLNRLEQVLIYSHLELSGADEALVLDSEGVVIECCTANLFWRYGDNVFTPRVNQTGVNGVMRQHCLKKLFHSSFYVKEVSVGLKALLHADEILICNALMPIVSVRFYEDWVWTSRKLYRFLSLVCNQTE